MRERIEFGPEVLAGPTKISQQPAVKELTPIGSLAELIRGGVAVQSCDNAGSKVRKAGSQL